MAEIFALPPHVAALWVAYIIIYTLFAYSPLLFSGAVALRRGRSMKRRVLFVGTVMMIAYGFLLLIAMAITVPVGVFALFFVPALKEYGYMQSGSFFLVMIDFAAEYWLLLWLPALAAASFVTTRYLAARWNGVAEALGG